MGNWPLLNVHTNIFFLLTFFRHVLTILAWTKCRLVTKHVLSITHFHSCFFLTFPFKFYLYKKFKLSIKDYLLLIYTFMFMIIFLRIIILSFQSHQTRILSAVLGMAWNRYGLSRNCDFKKVFDPSEFTPQPPRPNKEQDTPGSEYDTVLLHFF